MSNEFNLVNNAEEYNQPYYHWEAELTEYQRGNDFEGVDNSQHLLVAGFKGMLTGIQKIPNETGRLLHKTMKK